MMPSGGQCETTLFEEAMELGGHQCQRRFGHTVDGSEIRRLPVEVGSFSHYLQGFSTFPGGCLRFLNHQQYHVYTKYCKNKSLCKKSCFLFPLFESLQKSMSSFQFFSKNFAYLHDRTCIHQNYDFQKNPPNQKKN